MTSPLFASITHEDVVAMRNRLSCGYNEARRILQKKAIDAALEDGTDLRLIVAAMFELIP